MASLGIEPTTSGLDVPLLCRLSYEVGQRKSGTIKVVNRGEEKVRVHMNVVPRSTMNTNGGTEHKWWNRGQKNFFFTSCGSLIPFTKANAQWVFRGLHIAL